MKKCDFTVENVDFTVTQVDFTVKKCDFTVETVIISRQIPPIFYIQDRLEKNRTPIAELVPELGPEYPLRNTPHGKPSPL